MQQTLYTKQCSALLGVPAPSLETARCRKTQGFRPYYKIGRRVVYRLEEVERFMASRRVYN